MRTVLRILFVEDSEDDALLVLRQIKKSNYNIVYERVDIAEDMKNALKEKTWDIILSDYKMPHFDGFEALALLKESGIDIPFIIISGAIGEEVAVEAMKSGAHDYIMKNNLQRLLPAIERELRESSIRAERKHAETQIVKLNRIYSVLSNINQTIVRIHDCNLLLNEACRIIIEHGKFRMAWIGMENLQTNKIDVVASYGILGDYLQKINIDLNDALRSSGPAGIAFMTGKYKISNNIIHDDCMIPWRDDAIRYDYKSVASFPLKVCNKVVGVYLIYSNEPDFFQEDDIKLLDEMAMDISFALEFMESDTHRKQAEEALKESKNRYRRLIEGLTDYQYSVRVENGCAIETTQGPACTIVTGYKPEEFVNDPFLWFRMVAPEDHDMVRERLQQILAGKDIPPLEHRILRKDGEMRWVCDTTILLKDASGKLMSYDGVIKDITDRKMSEKSLQDSERKYRIVADNTFNWEFWLDPNNKFIYCSPSCFRVSGYTAEEFIENYELKIKIVHPDYQSIFCEHLNRISEDKTAISLQYKIIHKDGNERWIEHVCQPVFDLEGNYLGRRGSNCDITEKKETDRKILNAIISTEESERNKFSQELHDGLGPMLSTVKLYFEWLSETSGIEKQKSITETGLQNIDDAIQTVKEISNNLSPRILINMGLIPALKHLIHQINETKKLSIEFIFDHESRGNQQIEITLYRIISELLNNTIKYAHANRVIINLSHNDLSNHLFLTYSDNGDGFNFNKVIENKKGMGINNMMQRISTLNGFINFDTEEGKSLTVKIDLPLQINQ